MRREVICYVQVGCRPCDSTTLLLSPDNACHKTNLKTLRLAEGSTDALGSGGWRPVAAAAAAASAVATMTTATSKLLLLPLPLLLLALLLLVLLVLPVQSLFLHVYQQLRDDRVN